MAFITINPIDIESGETVTSELLTQVKDNFDDLNSRLIEVEVGGDVAYSPLIFNLLGKYAEWGNKDNVAFTTVNFTSRITGIRVIAITAGSGGATEIDIKRKRGAGAFVSVLSTRPSVASGAGDFGVSTNGIINPTYELLEPGDILRLDLIASQTGTPKSIMIRIDYVRE
jgi:hypothetical protein